MGDVIVVFYLRLFMYSVTILLSATVLCALVGAQQTRWFQVNRFDACYEDFGTWVQVPGYIDGFTRCVVTCLDDPNCNSAVMPAHNTTCWMNADPWVNPPINGCTMQVKYANVYGISTPVCSVGQSCTYPINNVRLCEGGGAGVCDPNQGRVEVFTGGSWGTVCDDYWGDFEHTYPTSPYEFAVDNSLVVCRMLGYIAAEARVLSFFGQGAGVIHMDNVACGGSETSLLDCSHTTTIDTFCTHSTDVSVICS